MAILFWICIGAAIFFAFRLGSHTGNAISSASNAGGMRMKYSKLIEHILGGHKDSEIMIETRTYIRAGVSNYGGNTIFHIQQCSINVVKIDYEVSNNPAIPSFTLHFTFDDRMDQDSMFFEMVKGLQKKMASLGMSHVMDGY